jgi:hypothetical protein
MVKTIEQEKIKFKELAKAIKALNDSDLLETKIATVGKAKEELVKLFIAGVQAVPDDADGNWTGPDEVAAYYMEITVAEEVAEQPVDVKTKKAPKAEKEKAPKAAKEKAPKVAKEKAAKPGKAVKNSDLAIERKQKRENFIKMLIEAGKDGITMVDVKKADWNPTGASFYAPLKAMIADGSAKMEGKKMVYIKKK